VQQRTILVQACRFSACSHRLHQSGSDVRALHSRAGLRISAPMKFDVKFFSEVITQSEPDLCRFIIQHNENLKAVLQSIGPQVQIHPGWDKR